MKQESRRPWPGPAGSLNFSARGAGSSLAVILVLAAGSVYLMKDIRSDNSDESFFLENDPPLLPYRFRELFGNEDYVYVAVRPGGDVFERSNMLMLKSLADALEKDVPFLREVKWLGSAEYIRPEGDHIAAVRP